MLLLLHTFLVACTVPEIPEFAGGGGTIYENGSPAEIHSEEEETESTDASDESSPGDTGSEETEDSGESNDGRESDEAIEND